MVGLERGLGGVLGADLGVETRNLPQRSGSRCVLGADFGIEFRILPPRSRSKGVAGLLGS